ncbi:helix-turn-helix domain-containing protein [Emcibacter sp. SYSU 3D8]|uniref:helix-turn-helix domain-containing protein n=1 Tax=Emcibacter sp. SYSU 3D8 TaxID=3133969 RepID=UPI0031FE56FE
MERTRTPRLPEAVLRRHHKLNQLSQTELGLLSGVGQKTVSKIANGNAAAKLDTLYELLAALDPEIVVMPRTNGSAQEIEELFS